MYLFGVVVLVSVNDWLNKTCDVTDLLLEPVLECN